MGRRTHADLVTFTYHNVGKPKKSLAISGVLKDDIPYGVSIATKYHNARRGDISPKRQHVVGAHHTVLHSDEKSSVTRVQGKPQQQPEGHIGDLPKCYFTRPCTANMLPLYMQPLVLHTKLRLHYNAKCPSPQQPVLSRSMSNIILCVISCLLPQIRWRMSGLMENMVPHCHCQPSLALPSPCEGAVSLSSSLLAAEDSHRTPS